MTFYFEPLESLNYCNQLEIVSTGEFNTFKLSNCYGNTYNLKVKSEACFISSSVVKIKDFKVKGKVLSIFAVSNSNSTYRPNVEDKENYFFTDKMKESFYNIFKSNPI